MDLTYTLLSDGSSDQTLLPVLTWLLREQRITRAIQPQWADLRRVPHKTRELAVRIRLSLELYPCELLFVHRDAESESRVSRVAEIRRALNELSATVLSVPIVCVVPVRMQEAWLLLNERAVRKAAGNPNGTQPVALPDLRHIEELPDPKSMLYDLLREASGLHGRRQRRLHVSFCARRVAEFVPDFGLLRSLSAFHALEADLRVIVESQRWADIN